MQDRPSDPLSAIDDVVAVATEFVTGDSSMAHPHSSCFSTTEQRNGPPSLCNAIAETPTILIRRRHLRETRDRGEGRAGVKRDDGDTRENIAHRLHGDRCQNEADRGWKGKVRQTHTLLIRNACGRARILRKMYLEV